MVINTSLRSARKSPVTHHKRGKRRPTYKKDPTIKKPGK